MRYVETDESISSGRFVVDIAQVKPVEGSVNDAQAEWVPPGDGDGDGDGPKMSAPSILYFDVHTSNALKCNYRLAVPGSIPNYRGAETIEVRGWIQDISAGVNVMDNPHDFTIHIEPDIDWLEQTYGIATAHKLVRIGSIQEHNHTGDNKHAWGTPSIKVELMSWHPGQTVPTVFGHRDVEDPVGWNYEEPPGHFWPWNPRYPSNDPAGPPLRIGDYVRIDGAIVTDNSHGGGWGAGGNCNGAQDRWTEIHPPDFVERLPGPFRKFQFALALYADHGWFSGEHTGFGITLSPAVPKDETNGRVRWQESIDGEHTNYRRIKEGNIGDDYGNTGARITEGPTYIQVFLGVQGDTMNGAPGKFKAFYRLWWEPGPKLMQIAVSPSSIKVGEPTQVTVTAQNTSTHETVNGQVVVGGTIVARTGQSFNYVFQQPTGGRVVADGYSDRGFLFPVVMRRMNVIASPNHVPLNRPVTLTVHAEDIESHTAVTGKVFIEGIVVADTNMPFTYTFRKIHGEAMKETALDEPITYWEHGTIEKSRTLLLPTRDGGGDSDGDGGDGGDETHLPEVTVGAPLYDEMVVDIRFQ